MNANEPMHITVPGLPSDPREPLPGLPGVVIHRTPPLHPDDLTMVDGLPVTTPARTIVDCAEDMTLPELRAMFDEAQRRGIVDLDALRASRARVEWRPSLPVVDALIEELERTR